VYSSRHAPSRNPLALIPRASHRSNEYTVAWVTASHTTVHDSSVTSTSLHAWTECCTIGAKVHQQNAYDVRLAYICMSGGLVRTLECAVF
jgi:hypothetical protein